MDTAGINAGAEEKTENIIVSKDTCCIILSSDQPFDNADIFIYNRNGVGEREKHLSYKRDPSAGQHLSDTLSATLNPGAKTMAVIANSARKFNDDALLRYDSTEQIQYCICDESSTTFLMSAVEEFSTSEKICKAALTPLRCSITLENIEHNLPGYKRLEDPYMMIENSSRSALILKNDGHRVTETLSDTSGLRGIIWEKLPYDIGMYAQQPGTTIFCYPCDDAASAVKPSLVIGCTVDGSLKEFRQELPLLPRGCTIMVSLRIGESTEDYDFSFRTIKRSTARIY